MKKGFTLVELLAVIAILSLILLLIVPKVNDILDQSQKDINKKSAEGIVEAAKIYYSDNSSGDMEDFQFNGVSNIFDKLNTKGQTPDNAIVKIKEDGDIAVSVLFEDTCYVKIFGDEKIEEYDKTHCAIDF